MAGAGAQAAFSVAQRIRKVAISILDGLRRVSALLAPVHVRLIAGPGYDYLIASAVGFALLVVAPMFGVWHDIRPTARAFASIPCAGPPEVFHGIASRYNWWIYPIALPLALGCIRHVARTLFCLGQGKACAIAELVEGDDKEAASVLINRNAVDPTVFGVVFVLALALNLVDVQEVLGSYLAHWQGIGLCPREKDWSVFFLVTNIGATKNLVFVLIAYTEQFLLALLGLLIFGLCFVHNILYLRLVYQRRRNEPIENRILLRFNDRDHRFGQSALHAVFDWQIIYLLLAGAAILVSRYANAHAPAQAIQTLMEKFAGKRDLDTFLPLLKALLQHDVGSALFPDIGQVILFVCFALCFLCVVIPSFLKFLPYGAIPKPQRSWYLAEFLPPTRDDDHDPLRMTPQQLDDTAKEFAQNSFWPAGDIIATLLFGVVFFVLLVILFPIPAKPLTDCIIGTIVTIVLATALTTLTFVLYRQALRVIDKSLVASKES
jgi:hypothetical protein